MIGDCTIKKTDAKDLFPEELPRVVFANRTDLDIEKNKLNHLVKFADDTTILVKVMYVS